MLEDPTLLELPPALAAHNWLLFTGSPTHAEAAGAAKAILDATEKFLRKTPEPRPAVNTSDAAMLAAQIAEEIRASDQSHVSIQNSLFVVHGHDEASLALLEDYLRSVGVTPILLSRRDESPQSLFQKFMSVAVQAQFAIVLFCSDDYGASRRQYDAVGVGERSLQFRARQNVVLELGFFYGRLGWENVFVVYQGPDRVFPNFERPSDLDGVVFDSITEAGWRKKLGAKLAAAGFDLSANS
jgi:predicted nucleotide-binding protein